MSDRKEDILDALGFEEVTPGRWRKQVRFHNYTWYAYVEPRYLMTDELIDGAILDMCQVAFRTAWMARSTQEPTDEDYNE